jgi:hypothetical protein
MSFLLQKNTLITLAILALLALAGWLISQFVFINTKDAVVDAQTYLGKHSNPQDIYAQPASGQFYSPFNLSIAPMDKLILVDFSDDPEYSSIELQVFADSRGPGARVILYRQEGPADFYYTSTAFADENNPDPASISPDMHYRFEAAASGLDIALNMKDRRGKTLEFQVREGPHAENAKGFLAPIGGTTAITFDYFPFFFLKGMRFIPRSGAEITIKIGGQARAPRQLPLPANWELVYLSRYTTQPILGHWNQPHDGPLTPLRPDALSYAQEKNRYDLVNNAGHYEIRRLANTNEQQEVSFEFSPPIPDLPALKDGAQINGRFSGGAGGVTGIIAGEYHLKRRGETIEMELLPLEGYQPNPGALWVKTWVWKGLITVNPDQTLAMKSGWLRQK